MNAKARKSNAPFALGFVALFAAMFAVMVNKRAFDPPFYTAVLFTLMAAGLVLGWLYEARRERQLDELELAAASFGARWSAGALATTLVLLLFVAPLQDGIVHIADNFEGEVPPPVGIFILGFVLAVFIQLGAKSVIGAVWMWTKR